MNLADGIELERPANDDAPTARVKSRVLVEWPKGTFVENIVARPDGKLIVAVHSDNLLELVDPSAARVTRDRFAELPGPVAGPALVDDDLFVLVSAPGVPPGRIFRVHEDGRVEQWVEIADALFLNGAAAFLGRSLLVGDAIKGRISRIDLDTRQVTTWLEGPLLGKVTAEPWLPGVNGLKVFGHHVYFSNTDAAHLGRVEFDAEGRPGPIEIIAQRFTCDDFAFDAAGVLYATTHVHNSVTSLSPNGERSVLADGADLAGSTAAAFGRGAGDRRTLYVTTTGGILAPHEGVVRSAKLLALDVSPQAEVTGKETTR